MSTFDYLDTVESQEKEAIRSAIILSKMRYDDEIAPFVRTSIERLESDLVQAEIDRIVTQASTEVGADPDVVGRRFKTVLADVIIPVTEPEKTQLEDGVKALPPEGWNDDLPEPGETTDVKDHGAVLVKEILYPDNSKIIPLEDGGLKHGSCFRCENESDDGLVCTACQQELVKQADAMGVPGAAPNAMAPGTGAVPLAQPCPSCGGQIDPATGKCSQCGYTLPQAVSASFLADKEADFGPPNSQLPAATTPVVPQGQAPQAPVNMTPLNPNAPYRCNVCGYTGTFATVSDHINNAQDTAHVQAKQNQHNQTTAATDDQPQDQGGAYEQNVHKDEVVENEGPQTPIAHFNQVIEDMANRAAARHFSQSNDDVVNKVAEGYGIDSSQIQSQLFGVADFGNYHAANGVIGGSEQVPQGFQPIDLDGKSGQSTKHEAVVPVNTAVRKVADDLGMDSNTVYQTIRDSLGDDLGDEYHTSVEGQYTYYLPQTVLDQATKSPHPEPSMDDQQGQQPPPQGGGAPPGPGQMGSPMQPVAPMGQQPQASVLSQDILDSLFIRDEKIQEQRMARRGYVKA